MRTDPSQLAGGGISLPSIECIEYAGPIKRSGHAVETHYKGRRAERILVKGQENYLEISPTIERARPNISVNVLQADDWNRAPGRGQSCFRLHPVESSFSQVQCTVLAGN